MITCCQLLLLWCFLTSVIDVKAWSSNDDDDDADDHPPPVNAKLRSANGAKENKPMVSPLPKEKQKAVEMELMAALDFEDDDTTTTSTTKPDPFATDAYGNVQTESDDDTEGEAEDWSKVHAETESNPQGKKAAEAEDLVNTPADDKEVSEPDIAGRVEEVGNVHAENEEDSESESGEENGIIDTDDESDWRAKDGGPTKEEREHFLRGWQDTRTYEESAESDEREREETTDDGPNKEEREHFVRGWDDTAEPDEAEDLGMVHAEDDDLAVKMPPGSEMHSETPVPAMTIQQFLYPDLEGKLDPNIILPSNSSDGTTTEQPSLNETFGDNGVWWKKKGDNERQRQSARQNWEQFITMDGEKNEEEDAGEPGTAAHLEALHHAVDLNGDGQLNVEELMKFAFQGHLKSSQEKAASIFQQMDQNGDRKLTFDELMQELELHKEGGATRAPPDEAEFQQVRAFQERRFRAADKNLDGVLDSAELPAFLFPETNSEALDKKTKDLLAKSDEDGDGKVDIKEFQTEFAIMDSSFWTEYTPTGTSRTFESLDNNHDGELDLGELKHLSSGNFTMVRTLTEFIEKADTDHDGMISVQDLTDAKEQILLDATYWQLSQYARHTDL
eukprot:gnl/MRDRNA2_/MRDRNA2_120604_c0_seq1.p1 gnl/MRDRNA2_/MRDRNA2_120604_c0~~gnl/MRDRNA2_/MRDRNA2_120604_c0_seq1.p1  ORF type:complete len:617 (+),score=202.46 gnl/MRDRNA2_/MRDRNA2_120604_c0_seq1:66-1916(+)